MLIETEKVNVRKSKAVEISAFLGRAGSSFLPGVRPCPGSRPAALGGTGAHRSGGEGWAGLGWTGRAGLDWAGRAVPG